MSAEVIRFVMFRECGEWVAQGLERDLCVQASDIGTLQGRLRLMLEHWRREEGRTAPANATPAAPGRFYQMFDERFEIAPCGESIQLSYRLALADGESEPFVDPRVVDAAQRVILGDGAVAPTFGASAARRLALAVLRAAERRRDEVEHDDAMAETLASTATLSNPFLGAD